jgi:hypothetical protein
VSRELVYEDEFVRRYEVRDDAGDLIGSDEESTQPPPEPCPTCGGTGYLT